jgi:hypothetical protein
MGPTILFSTHRPKLHTGRRSSSRSGRRGDINRPESRRAGHFPCVVIGIGIPARMVRGAAAAAAAAATNGRPHGRYVRWARATQVTNNDKSCSCPASPLASAETCASPPAMTFLPTASPTTASTTLTKHPSSTLLATMVFHRTGHHVSNVAPDAWVLTCNFSPLRVTCNHRHYICRLY